MILLELANLNCHILSHWATFMYVAFYFILYFIFIFCNPAVRLQNTINQCDEWHRLGSGSGSSSSTMPIRRTYRVINGKNTWNRVTVARDAEAESNVFKDEELGTKGSNNCLYMGSVEVIRSASLHREG